MFFSYSISCHCYMVQASQAWAPLLDQLTVQQQQQEYNHKRNTPTHEIKIELTGTCKLRLRAAYAYSPSLISYGQLV
jgi:hypothetical protein